MDLLPRMRKRQITPAILLDISLLEDLRYIRERDGVVHLGALATVTDLLESSIFEGRLSIIREAAALFGAPQVRNAVLNATGVSVDDLPVTSEKVLMGIKHSQAPLTD